jgi:hypothetical protein
MMQQVSFPRRSRRISLLAVVMLLGISLATVVFAQSGRNQGKAPKASTTKTKSRGSVS